jgi:hypothetical protein
MHLTSYIMDNRIVINMSSANFHTMDHTEEIMLSYHLDTYWHFKCLMWIATICVHLAQNVKESVHALAVN